jgi:hypothetical protein
LDKLTEDDETGFLTFLTVIDNIKANDEHGLKCQTVNKAMEASTDRCLLRWVTP